MFEEIVKKYFGKGTFHFYLDKEITQDLGFSLVLYSNAKIEIECYPIEGSLQTLKNIVDLINIFAQNRDIKVSMNGEVYPNEKINPKGKIKVEDAYVTNLSINHDKEIGITIKLKLLMFNLVEIIYSENQSKTGNITAFAGLTNFVFGGCNTILSKDDTIKVEFEEFEVYFIQNENYKEQIKYLENKEKTILVTSEAFMEYSKMEQLNFSEIMTHLSDLVSYPSRNRITHIYEDYYFEGKYLKTILRPAITKEYYNGNTLIDFKHWDNCNLKFYLESCFKTYLESLDNFAFNIIITFYLEAVTHNYQDISFLLGTTTIETILTGYSEVRKEEGNPIIGSNRKKNKKEIIKILEKNLIDSPNELAEKIVEKISSPHPNVNDKLSNLIKDERFSMKLHKYDRDFMNIRNQIAHTGQFPEIINSSGKMRDIILIKELNRLIYLLDRIMLTILDYTEKPFLNKMTDTLEVLEKNK